MALETAREAAIPRLVSRIQVCTPSSHHHFLCTLVAPLCPTPRLAHASSFVHPCWGRDTYCAMYRCNSHVGHVQRSAPAPPFSQAPSRVSHHCLLPSLQDSKVPACIAASLPGWCVRLCSHTAMWLITGRVCRTCPISARASSGPLPRRSGWTSLLDTSRRFCTSAAVFDFSDSSPLARRASSQALHPSSKRAAAAQGASGRAAGGETTILVCMLRGD